LREKKSCRCKKRVRPIEGEGGGFSREGALYALEKKKGGEGRSPNWCKNQKNEVKARKRSCCNVGGKAVSKKGREGGPRRAEKRKGEGRGGRRVKGGGTFREKRKNGATGCLSG